MSLTPVTFLNQAAAARRTILLEGAQATLLDVNHGTYPFVTSSSTTVGGACVGTGLAPKHITGVLGIVRTYTTRVGEGPFPTEMLEGEAKLGHLIRERGREYGASTGRPRRCGVGATCLKVSLSRLLEIQQPDIRLITPTGVVQPPVVAR